jgi:hypothetical protein
MAALRIQQNRDGTVTVRRGRAVEHIDARGKTKAELFDAVRYAAITMGTRVSDVALIEALQGTSCEAQGVRS